MTVQTTTSRADYTGNGVTTAFTVPFYFLDNTHIQVLRTQISTGITTTLALSTDYTVSGAGVGSGGSITCVVAPTSDQKISILRNVPFTQLTHYVENDPFPAASHERALDQVTMEVQQLSEAQSRALTLSKASSGVSTALPTPQGSRFIGWDASATYLINYDPSTVGAVLASEPSYTAGFSGNGSTTTFDLGSYPGSNANTDVFISGVRQRPTLDYDVVSTTVVFTSAPPSGTNNILVKWSTVLGTEGLTAIANTATAAASSAASSVSAASASASAASSSASAAATSATNAANSATAAAAAVTSALPLAGGTMTGPVVMSDQLLSRAMLKDQGYTYYNSNTTNALDYVNGSHQRWAPSTGAQTLTIANWPPTGNLGELLIEGVNLGAATITWPTINWIKSDGTTTTTFSGNGVTLQASGTDFVVLWTRDAGTTIYGKIIR